MAERLRESEWTVIKSRGYYYLVYYSIDGTSVAVPVHTLPAVLSLKAEAPTSNKYLLTNAQNKKA